MIILAIFWLFIEKFVLIGLIITLSMVVAMYSTYAERKIAAFLQDRIGPNRAGIFGILQPLADGGKLFFKEEIIPLSSSLAHLLSMISDSFQRLQSEVCHPNRFSHRLVSLTTFFTGINFTFTCSAFLHHVIDPLSQLF